MDGATVDGGSGWGQCPIGTVDVKFIGFQEMNRLQSTVCKTQTGSGSSTSRGRSGPVEGFYTGGTVYATDLDSVIHEIRILCG